MIDILRKRIAFREINGSLYSEYGTDSSPSNMIFICFPACFPNSYNISIDNSLVFIGQIYLGEIWR